jgi:hypothetical protein
VGRYQVTAEIMGAIAGPKINMIQYRNKTGYRRRLGHRQHYTQLRITGISADGAPAKRSAARSTAKTDAGKAAAPKVPAARAAAAKAPATRGGAAKGKPAAAGKKD